MLWKRCLKQRWGGDEVEQGIVTMATVCDGVISAHNIRWPNEGWSNVPTTDMVQVQVFQVFLYGKGSEIQIKDTDNIFGLW